MKILFAASEIFPYAKSGGLGDVAQALPRSLSKYADIIRVMPLYGFLDKTSFKKEDLFFELKLGQNTYNITIYSDIHKDITTYFIDSDIFSRNKEFYTTKSGSYSNDNPNFGVFSAAIVELAKHVKADLLHLNDWHCALAALFIKEKAPHIKTVFTIHNLAYQGIFDKNVLEQLGIDGSYFNMDDLEFYDKVSFIKAGIAYSDAVTTVSEQYAKEILTEQFGCGLHSFLSHHSKKLSGILNGIDYDIFNPKTDNAIESRFDENSIELKNANKQALLSKLEFKDTQIPTFVMVSRLVEQKGFGLLLDSLDDILNKKLNLIILAEGEGVFKHKLEHFAEKYDNFHLNFGYDEDFSHKVYASGDFLLMPSLFEPCGLNQMIAMRYGTIPIVNSVGGLKDTVHEDNKSCAQGIVFTEPTKDSLICAVEKALKLYLDKTKMANTISFNMGCNFSFEKSALLYSKLYKKVLG
ncbi:glycogen synthase [Sulfurimonas sp.]|uniref:glycogen synthase n=1 Tax=Sulfurimonas sp. TaxID=2022749 RepID=UPI003562C6C4